ncbi:amino acid/amide ABC transporter membrane protein 2 (HAAT family) [Nitrospirillum amazonense]|uniref:Amino acid/amide ABC transporter membrane protein 2 (HAAT family) n=1 Tax=Nitrospirillum amazonense TaxID=28077 RepID=A0A560JCW3_9PROT|nr:branched-chain amino acid ABC transporter permease [Nitrospirillum amazonense]TWB66260.1 amino acid/amide ABC transporter membrane protein 2 (HAAT family) [Nitrospirillum amazonense]
MRLPPLALLALAALALLLAAPWVIYPAFLMKALCFALFAAAFNLLLGYAGLLSFGHAAFFGGAAYVTAHAAKVWGWPPELAILGGTLAAALLGLAMGALAIRRQGIYFAMTTLALAQMLFFLFLQAPFTGGEDGIQGVPQGRLLGLIDLGQPTSAYYAVLAIAALGHLALYRIIHSPFGQVLKAVRDNEARARSLGYEVDRYKLTAFVLSATLAGLAGGTKALVFQIATLADVQWQMSGEVVLMTLLGGIGTVAGPAVGAFLSVGLESALATSGLPVAAVIGAVFIACVLVFRRGLVGEIGARLKIRI